jgi:hypothetical protein
MKKLILLLLALVAFSAEARSSDVVIPSSQQANFNPSTIGNDTTITVTVTNGSAAITSANQFRSEWVGLKGFTVTIAGVRYVVDSVTDRSNATLTTTYAASSGSASAIWHKWVEVRWYSSLNFRPAGKSYVIQAGAPGNGAWFARYAASVINVSGVNTLFWPDMTIDSTVDSVDNNQARYTLGLYPPGSNSPIQTYTCSGASQLRIPAVSPTSLADICIYNSSAVVPSDNSTYTRDQVNARFPSCTAASIAYYQATGNTQKCLTAGSGITINTTTNTISASGGGGGGVNIRNALNAVADYSAPTNGSSDATSALQSCFNASTAAKPCYVPGIGVRYLVTALNLSDNMVIVGDGGWSGQTLIESITNAPIFNVSSTAFNLRMSGIKIRGSVTAGSSQIGLNLAGSAEYWGVKLDDLRIEDTGSYGLYFSQPFSSNVSDLFITNTVGYPLLYDASNRPSNHFTNVYVGTITATAPIGYRIKGGEFNCVSCNGVNNVLAGSWWMAIGKKAGVDGDVSNGTAQVHLTDSNLESWTQKAIKFYYNSSATIDGRSNTANASVSTLLSAGIDNVVTGFNVGDTTYFGAPIKLKIDNEVISCSGKTPTSFTGCTRGIEGTAAASHSAAATVAYRNVIIFDYEVDPSLFPDFFPPGYIADTFTIGTGPESNFDRDHAAHSTGGNPPVQTMGQGPGVSPTNAVPALSDYWDETNSRAVKLRRADGNLSRLTVTGTTTIPAVGANWIEANCPSACTITLPWPGYYRTQRAITIKDVSGAAASNNITIQAASGGSVNGGSYTINQNGGSVTLIANDASTDYRVVSSYPSGAIGGSVATDQVAFGSGANTITGSANMTFNLANPAITLKNVGVGGFFSCAGGCVGADNGAYISPSVLNVAVYSDTATDTSYVLHVRGRTAGYPQSGYVLGTNQYYGSNGTTPSLGAEFRALATQTHTASAAGSKFELSTSANGSVTPTLRQQWDNLGNVVLGTAALSTSATDGFFYLAGMAGSPSGTPTSFTGRVPLTVDTTNSRLYGYFGGSWVNLSSSGAVTGSGTTNQFAYWTSSSAIGSSSNFAWTPSTADTTLQGSNATLSIRNTGTTPNGWVIASGAGNIEVRRVSTSPANSARIALLKVRASSDYPDNGDLLGQIDFETGDGTGVGVSSSILTAATENHSGSAYGSSWNLQVVPNGSTAAVSKFLVDGTGSMVFGNAALSTSATAGFVYLPSMAGNPSGVPTSYTGRVPLTVDTTNSRLYGYFGGSWVNLTGAGGGSSPFADNAALVKNNADNTKLLIFSAASIATGTTRTLTAQDANYTIAGINLAETWTANQTFGSGILRATRPQFTTSLDDSNGNEVIDFTATASAVNEIAFANAATTAAPSIKPAGGDTNISLEISPKGTGGIGVNTNAPTAMLHVKARATSNEGLQVDSNSGAISGIYTSDGSTLILGGTTNHTLEIWSNGTARVSITGAGVITANGAGNFRATSPRFTTDISDSNGNEVFKITATASAVNEFTIANAATGGTPTITASGGDTDVGLNFVPKGAGTIQVSGSPIATAAKNLSFFSSTTSAQLAGVISDETGSGPMVFGTSPTLATPILSSYADMTRISAPSNPSAGSLRLFANNATGKLACLDSSGADCMPAGGGGSPAGSTGDFQINNGGSFGAGVIVQGSTGRLTVTPTAQTSGTEKYFRIITPADTGQTASTEVIGAQFGGNTSAAAVTRQWATGALTLQRENVFVAPAYAFAGPSTLATAATVAITGAPIPGTNATITTPVALQVQAGRVMLPSDGFEGAPTLMFSSSTNTGIYYSASEFAGGTIAFSTGGAMMGAFTNQGGTGLRLRGTAYLGWGALGPHQAPDVLLSKQGTGILQIGIDASSPVTQTIQSHGGSGSNIAGATLNLLAGKGTGTGVPGNIGMQFARPGSSGSSLNTQSDQISFSYSTDALNVITQLKSSTTANRDATRIKSSWVDNTDASRTAQWAVGLVSNAGSLADNFVIRGTSTVPEFYFGNGVTSAAPLYAILTATGGSGTNSQGENLWLSGAKSTGNAEPGQLVQKYPLVGASGTTLQSLNTDEFVIPSVVLTSTADANVQNTTTETTILGSGVGATSIEGGLLRVGRTVRVTVRGSMVATGSPTLTIRFKLGGTTVASSTAKTIGTSGTAGWEMSFLITARTLGASGTAYVQGLWQYSDNNDVSIVPLVNTGTSTIDTTGSLSIGLTAQWSAAASGNRITGTNLTVEYLNGVDLAGWALLVLLLPQILRKLRSRATRRRQLRFCY